MSLSAIMSHLADLEQDEVICQAPHYPIHSEAKCFLCQSHLPFCARARQLMMYSITDPLGHIQFKALRFAGCHLSLEEIPWHNA